MADLLRTLRPKRSSRWERILDRTCHQLRTIAIVVLGLAICSGADDPASRPRTRINPTAVRPSGGSPNTPRTGKTTSKATLQPGVYSRPTRAVAVVQELTPEVGVPALQNGSNNGNADPNPAQSLRDIERQIQVKADGRITLHMDDLDVRRALELLSRQGGLNIMLSTGVSGRVTANLEGATVDQALKAILKLGNLTARREEGLIYVYTAQDFKDQSTYNQQITTRIYRLNYIRASDLMTMVRDILSADGTMTATPESNEGINDSPTFNPSGVSGGGGGGGGGGGAVTAPSSTGGGGGSAGRGTSGGNSLSGGDVVIVRDYESKLRAVDEIVARLDIQPVQVLVEAVIVSVELTREQEFGVNYSAVDNLGRALGTIGNGSELAANSGFTPAKLLTVPLTATAAAQAAAGRINGGTATGGLNSTTNGIKFGFVSKNNSGFIRALETLGETRVLASPRLLVLNKQKAEIQLGQRLGYSTVTQNFTSTVQQVQFLNTGTLLRLRPFVSSDGMVRMEIHPERSSGSIGANNLPNSNTAEVTTNVMIPNGSTLVIGGLIENEDDFNYEGLPGIHRFPALGAVFGFRARTKAKRELIVMLTPKIMKPGTDTFPGPDPVDAETVAKADSNGTDAVRVSAANARDADRAVREVRAAATTRSGGLAADRDHDSAATDELASIQPPPSVHRASLPNREVASKQHVVKRGENFWMISKSYYGSGKFYLSLWYANRDRAARPESLRVGDQIRVPEELDLDRRLEVDPKTNRLLDGKPASVAVDELMAAQRRSSVTTVPAARAVATEGTIREAREESVSVRNPIPSRTVPKHVVARDESLQKIARARLGDSRRAIEIFELNRAQIPRSGQLTPGQRLTLPGDAVSPAGAR
jgi:type IV pilus secretin PilQ/predicted competence protein